MRIARHRSAKFGPISENLTLAQPRPLPYQQRTPGYKVLRKLKLSLLAKGKLKIDEPLRAQIAREKAMRNGLIAEQYRKRSVLPLRAAISEHGRHK